MFLCSMGECGRDHPYVSCSRPETCVIIRYNRKKVLSPLTQHLLADSTDLFYELLWSIL